MNDQRPLNPADVAKVFGVTDQTVRNWADDGKLPHFKTPGGQYRFNPDDVEAFRAGATS